jgi:hypothetical protein
MKKILVAALAATAGIAVSAGAVDARPNTACQQFGISVLQGQGLLPAVAKGGLEYPIGSGNTIAFSDVLAVHRDDPALANQVLTDYALALGIATPAVVEALNAACPTG